MKYLLLLFSLYGLACHPPEPPSGADTPPEVADAPYVVFVTGDEEYRSEESMRMLADLTARELGARVRVCYAVDSTGIIDPNRNDHIEGLAALDSADLMVLFTRWRNLPRSESDYLTRYADSTFAPALVRVNDWYDRRWGGGFNATFACVPRGERRVDESNPGFTVAFGYTGRASIERGWSNYNGPIEFGAFGLGGGFAARTVDGTRQPQRVDWGTATFSVSARGAGFSASRRSLIMSRHAVASPEPHRGRRKCSAPSNSASRMRLSS